MTAALGDKEGQLEAYFEQFKDGTAKYFHMLKSTLVNKFQQKHIEVTTDFAAITQVYGGV